jgi:membrane protein implicated in regulation of membrane protease activity
LQRLYIAFGLVFLVGGTVLTAVIGGPHDVVRFWTLHPLGWGWEIGRAAILAVVVVLLAFDWISQRLRRGPRD